MTPPWRTVLPVLIGLLAGLGLLQPSPARAEAALFEGARVIVGDGSVIEDAALLVVNGKVASVGRRGDVAAPSGAVRTDLTGKTMMPAMIAGHAHPGFESETGWGLSAYSRANIVDHLYRNAYYGFAAVYAPGLDPRGLFPEISRAQAQGTLGGARLVWSPGMAPPGQGPNQRLLNEGKAAGLPMAGGVAGPAEARRAVREVAAAGARFIKIWVDDRGGSQVKLSPETYGALIDEARRRGIQVHAHHGDGEDMKGLLKAGVAGFLHGRVTPDVYDEEVFRLLREKRPFIAPNLSAFELRREARAFEDPFLQETLSPETIARLRATAPAPRPVAAEAEAAQRRIFARLLADDIPIVLGSDAGAVPDHFFGYADHKELEIYVRLGMTPMQAIVAATSRPAEALGLPDLGLLAPGRSADFLVLEANPLEDIRNTRSLSRVFLRGVELDRAALRETWRRGGRVGAAAPEPL